MNKLPDEVVKNMKILEDFFSPGKDTHWELKDKDGNIFKIDSKGNLHPTT